MRLIRKPWIWVARLRQRKGYGVHSPFAYSFIRGVVLEGASYYAYSHLARLHPWWVRWGGLYPMKCRRLLFRLANFARPKTVTLLTEDTTAQAYVRAAVPSAKVAAEGDFTFVGAAHLAEAPAIAATMSPQGMLVCEGIHRNANTLAIWHSIQQHPHTGITFDLYTYGVAFFDPSLHKQHYKVNF